MIRNFQCKHTRSLFEGKDVKKWQAIRQQAERRLQILDMAVCLDDLRGLPSNRLEALHGDRKGQYSIRINNQWRICFSWVENEAHDVEIVDYH
jgi:proteic killer suppression protein